MKKLVIFFLLFSCVLNAVNYPPEEKRGIKRSIHEIIPTEPTPIASVEEQLIEATKNGNTDMMTTILDNTTIDIDNRYAHEKTLLMIAVNSEQPESVNVLLERDADVNLQDDEGRTALHIAVSKNNVPITVRLLNIPTIDLNVPNNNGSTPLLSGIISESIDTVNLLLTPELVEGGLNINTVNNNGETALKLSVEQNNLALFNKLLSLGAYINQMTSEGPLISFALWNDRTDIVMRMLEISGTKVDMRNAHGVTPLMIAAFNGNIEIAKKLLEKNANFELKDSRGLTAFDYAMRSDSPNKYHMMVLLRPK